MKAHESTSFSLRKGGTDHRKRKAVISEKSCSDQKLKIPLEVRIEEKGLKRYIQKQMFFYEKPAGSIDDRNGVYGTIAFSRKHSKEKGKSSLQNIRF